MDINDISYNFNIAKVLSILMITTGHYFGGILWIPTTFALFIFAFSSGFFTSRKYQRPFDSKKFWKAKIIRLFWPILIIDIFLFFLFSAIKRSGIYSWQTLPSIFGMNGFFAWFYLPNPSPFGAGLWFFTLLLLFYLSYPLLSIINTHHPIAIVFLLISLLLATILHYALPMEHMLWMTLFAFILGNYSGVHEHKINPWIFISLFTICCLLLVYLNKAISYNFLNYFLIIIASISLIGYLLNSRLPKVVLNKFLAISDCIIQIYFIHTYLFIKSSTNQPVVNYAISILTIISVAFILSKISKRLRSLSEKHIFFTQ